jgi:uncharacterized membrane protein
MAKSTKKSMAKTPAKKEAKSKVVKAVSTSRLKLSINLHLQLWDAINFCGLIVLLSKRINLRT